MAARSASWGRWASFTSGTTGRPTIRLRAGNEDRMARYMFVVSLRHPALYDYLLQRFADDPNAQVVLDRGRIERRRAAIAVTRERRQGDRRQRPDLSEGLRRRSVAVVTISDGRGES